MGRKFVYLTVLSAVALTGCGGGGSSTPQTTTDFVVRTGSAGLYERFIIRVSDPATIAKARQILNGESPQLIVTGKLVDGNGGFNMNPSTNRDWTWSLQPSSVRLVASSSAIYDGTPSYIESNKARWLEVGTYTPSSSRIESEIPK